MSRTANVENRGARSRKKKGAYPPLLRKASVETGLAPSSATTVVRGGGLAADSGPERDSPSRARASRPRDSRQDAGATVKTDTRFKRKVPHPEFLRGIGPAKPTITIVGIGSLGSALALALRGAGFRVKELIARDSSASLRRAKRIASRVGARATILRASALDSDLIWICVPDREIRNVALEISRRLSALEMHTRGKASPLRFAFHSSGALDSSELDALRQHGIAIASVHPLMTFVENVKPSLKGVPVAIEGDATAQKLARVIVARLGGEAISLSTSRKSAYHAWATMSSPLLIAYLVTLEEAASGAGLSKSDARRLSLPIIQQTLANYSRFGPSDSFSGPIIRGDLETVSGHLAALKHDPRTLAVYRALAQMAVDKLPAKNRQKLRALLESSSQKLDDKTARKV